MLKKINAELKQHIDKQYKIGSQNFFKEDVNIFGVRAPIVRKIANKYWQEIKNLEKKKIFNLCEELLKEGYLEKNTIAFQWARKLERQFIKSDFKIFDKWLKKHVTNWASCDDFCTHAFGDLIYKYPDLMPKIKEYTKSKNRWVRRASAVILINPLKKQRDLEHAFEIADKLLLDEDDLVQKGYGWMLKEASNIYQAQVYNFVIKRKEKMPRTALRYAIEKMPKEMKKEAMKK
jgi:3-methyladenine DNA glycosylase AlkD